MGRHAGAIRALVHGFQTHQDWTGVDLNKKDVLFCLLVAEKFRSIVLSVVSPE